MNVFFEKGLFGINKEGFKETFQKVGINPKFFELTFNVQSLSIDLLNETLQKDFKGKNIVITTKVLKGKRQFGLNFEYHGIANERNGSLGIVTANNYTKEKVDLIALHETLHLCGLAHCNTHGCLMAYKLCSYFLQYCLNCQHPCKPIFLCEKCKSELNLNDL